MLTIRSETIDATGVSLVQAKVERGDVDYSGGSPQTFQISGSSWGMAAQDDRAFEREEGNAYAVSVSAGALQLSSASQYSNAGVNFDILGPSAMSMDVETGSGDVRLANIAGYQLVTADDIDLVNVIGSADLYSRDGDIDAEISPAPGDAIRIEAVDGEVILALPYGQAYNLQVWGDPEYEMIIDDLGFHSVQTGPAYYAGIAGRGDIPVDVFVTGGSVRIMQTW